MQNDSRRALASAIALGAVIALEWSASGSAHAIEGPAVAGPIGGTDVRSAQLPPPGVYGGVIAAAATALDFRDGDGEPIPALRDAELTRNLAGAFIFYVPKGTILGGSLGMGALFLGGNSCGHLFPGEAEHCQTAFGDPYVEVDWSRHFGHLRVSEYAGAAPIAEGLTVLVGAGLVVPIGEYHHETPLRRATSIGTNIWDFAPTVALTYTTPPIFFEGTEFSAKAYWNNYRENPDTRYQTGDLINIDFAITERIGRVQVGLAGLFATQIADDRVAGVPIPPDGLQAETLQLGGVIAYDMPEIASAMKVKAFTAVHSEHTVTSWAVALTWFKKF